LDLWTVLFGIGTLVLGVVLGLWLPEYVKRPLLRFSGSGVSGGATPVTRYSLTVTNDPAFIGIKIGSTAILGRQLHGPIFRGLAVDRNPATQCSAQLVDKASGDPIVGLYWRSRTQADRYEASTTIPGGESAILMLFARLSSEPTEYFVFQPEPSPPHHPHVPEDYQKFTGDRQFEVHVYHRDGRVKGDVNVRIDYSGNFYVDRVDKRGRRNRNRF
jgi:hypothetical protein